MAITLPPVTDEETMAHERYIVRCDRDGQVRHDEPFDWIADAKAFALHGHVCFGDHTITTEHP